MHASNISIIKIFNYNILYVLSKTNKIVGKYRYYLHYLTYCSVDNSRSFVANATRISESKVRLTWIPPLGITQFKWSCMSTDGAALSVEGTSYD